MKQSDQRDYVIIGEKYNLFREYLNHFMKQSKHTVTFL